MAVLWALEHFRPYVWGRKITLITDGSALTWLFKSRDLSSKQFWWSLRLIEWDVDLQQWRPGTRHQLPDALSRLPCSESPSEDIDQAFPDESSSRQTYRGPEGPVLDGMPLTEFGVDQVDEPQAKNVVAVAGVAITLEEAAGNVEGAAQALRSPRLSKPTTEGFGFSGGDGEHFEGLASLGEIWWSCNSRYTRALIRASVQPSSVFQRGNNHLNHHGLRRKILPFAARRVRRKTRNQRRRIRLCCRRQLTHCKNSLLLEEKQKRDAMLEPILAKLGSGEKGGEHLLDGEGIIWYAP